MSTEDPPNVERHILGRDADTLAHLAVAEEAIERALKSMPNHVDSIFDPSRDVPSLERALQGVREAIVSAQDTGRERWNR